MTSGSDWQDPFLTKPDASIRSGRPIDAPPPAGPRFDGAPPPSGARPASWSATPDPEVYGPPPLGGYPQPFSRTWKVTFRRWGRSWLAFIVVALVCSTILAVAFPSPVHWRDGGSMASYFGTLLGAALVYLALVGWWLDHILVQAGPRVSLAVQAIVAGAVALAGGTGAEDNGDPIGFPLGFLFLFGVLAAGLTHALGRKVEGSFMKPDDSFFSPSGYSPFGM